MNKLLKFGAIVLALIACGLVASATQIELRTSGDAVFPGGVTAARFNSTGNMLMNGYNISEVEYINFTSQYGGLWNSRPPIYMKAGYPAMVIQAYNSTARPTILFTNEITDGTHPRGYDVMAIQCHNLSADGLHTEEKHCKMYVTGTTGTLDSIWSVGYAQTDPTWYWYTASDFGSNQLSNLGQTEIDVDTDNYYGLSIDMNTKASGKAIDIYSNVNATADYPLIYVHSDNALFDQYVMQLRQDGANDAVFIDMNTNNYAIKIDTEASSAAAIYVDNSAGAPALYQYYGANYYTKLGQSLATSTGSHYMYRNYNSTLTAGPIMQIENDNALDDQDTLYLNNDGTGDGLSIDADGINAINIIDGNIAMANDVKYTFNGSTTVFMVFNSTLNSGSLCLKNGAAYLCLNSTDVYMSAP